MMDEDGVVEGQILKKKEKRRALRLLSRLERSQQQIQGDSTI